MKKIVLIVSMMMCLFSYAYAAEKVYDTDVVVVGAGAGGTVAAVSSLEAGFKTILLEKMPAAGGAGNFMEGSFAVESFMQKDAGVKLTKMEAFNKIMTYHKWTTNAALTKAFVDESAETIQWVWDHGVKFKEVKSAFKDNPNKTWHLYPGGGSSLIKAMVSLFSTKGGTFLLETPAKKLIFDKNGKITGVMAENEEGDVIRINAKYVILATGGFANNADMIKKYGGPESTPNPPKGRDGDGINMALSAGAILDKNMDTLQLNGAFMVAPGEAICNGPNAELRAMFRQSLLYVNEQGERFFNEEITIDWPAASNAISRAGKYVYVVFDAATLKEFQTTGYLNPCGNWIQREQPMKKFDQLFPANEKKGYAFQGKTLDELAKKMGVNPAELKLTAGNMTAYAKNGYDNQFGKNMRFVRAVDQGPFYALKGQLYHLTTVGGVKVNAHLQPVNEAGKAIEKLYVIGNDAGGLYGDTYDLFVAEGATSGFAINGARLAVKHIQSLEKNK